MEHQRGYAHRDMLGKGERLDMRNFSGVGVSGVEGSLTDKVRSMCYMDLRSLTGAQESSVLLLKI